MLTIYAPSNNPNSKCWRVFNGVKESWPDEVSFKDNSVFKLPNAPAMFWGFVNNNTQLIRQLEVKGLDYYFTDTPYFGRFNNANLTDTNHYWRICKNRIHAKFIKDCPDDRLKRFNIKIKERSKSSGDYILICPSSAGIDNYLHEVDWLSDTVKKIKQHTDRPVRIRKKPRGKGTSGPSVAKISIEEDLKNAWACVTSCSISAVEAICEGVPVFCHSKSFATAIGSTDLSKIETPFYTDPSLWLNSLTYQQFTPEEYRNGTAVSIMRDIGIL
jgi:hypothetical protein